MAVGDIFVDVSKGRWIGRARWRHGWGAIEVDGGLPKAHGRRKGEKDVDAHVRLSEEKLQVPFTPSVLVPHGRREWLRDMIYREG